MHGRLAAGELHGKLPPRLDLYGVVQDFLNLFPAQLMNVAHLVRVHEAGIAHHVAAIRQIDGQHRSAAVPHRARSVLVQPLVVVRGNIAAGEVLFDPGQEARIDGHQVLVRAVDRTFLHHPDLPIALDDLRLDLPHLFVHQILPVFLSAEDRLARLFHAAGAQRIGLPRKAQRGLGLLPRLQQRLFGPFRRERRVRIELVEKLQRVESHPGGLAHRQVHQFPRTRTCACFSRHESPRFPTLQMNSEYVKEDALLIVPYQPLQGSAPAGARSALSSFSFAVVDGKRLPGCVQG